MQQNFDTTAPKKATNLSVNSDLLHVAKKLGINLSATLEEALVEKVRQQKKDAWLAANKEAIQHYNEFVGQHGAFSNGLRCF